MNGEILIKARKVFVEDNIVENSEDCPHCMSKGLQKKLRYFYLSLEEKIYKCENSTCLYPFQRFIFKSLTDDTVYYYEEVLDGKRELFFRVPLDEQNDYQLSNPLSTQLFCDNQRNPDIEDYNCDFSDLFDFDDVVSSQTKMPASTDNLDALEFLDEINVTTHKSNTSHGPIENEIGIDSIIDDILNESPQKCSSIEPLPSTSMQPPPSPQYQSIAQNAADDTSLSKPKLKKCIQHLEKVKKTQSRKKTCERVKNPFAAAILEARKSQTKLKDDSASANQQPESQQKLKLKQTQRSNSPATFLKSANNLRPIDLARKLSTMKSINTNSQFLQQYMKTKEEKLFVDEPEAVDQVESKLDEAMTTSNEVSKPNNDCLPLRNSNQNVLPEANTKSTIDNCSERLMYILESIEKPNSSTMPKKSESKTSKKSTPRKSMKKEASIVTPEVCEEKKKGRNPRSKKPGNTERLEPPNSVVPVNQNSEPCLKSTGNLDQNKDTSIKTEPKKNARKRKVTPVNADDKSMQNVGPAKRQRKPKCESAAKAKQQNDPTMAAVVEYSMASTAALATDDQMQMSDPCHTAEMIQHDSTDIKSGSVCIDSTNDSKICSGNEDEQQPKPTEKGDSKSVKKEPVKRQRKSKLNSDTTAEQNENIKMKPKRVRATKPKANLIKMEQSSLILLPNDGATDSQAKSTNECPEQKLIKSESCEFEQQKSSEPAQKGKINFTAIAAKRIKQAKIDHELKLKEEMCEEPSTSVDCSTPNLMALLASDSMHTNVLNPCGKAETLQKESACENTDGNQQISEENDNGQTAKPIKRQRKSKSNNVAGAEKIASVDIKPKRSRAKKPKANPIKNEQQPQLHNDVSDSQTKSDLVGESNASDTSVCAEPKLMDSNQLSSSPNVCEGTDDGFISIKNEDEQTTDPWSAASTQQLNRDTDVDIKTEPKKNVRKRKSTTVNADELKLAEKSNSEKVKPIKRPRKSKCGSDAKTEQSVSIEIKPKRGRATKPRANPSKSDQPIMLQIDDATGECNTSITDSQINSDVEGKSNATEANIYTESISEQTLDSVLLKRSNECEVEPIVMDEMCENPLTSQENPMVKTIVEYVVVPNDLIAILSGDSHSCRSAETIQQTWAGAERINSSETTNEQQPKLANVTDSIQLIQPKLEPMENDASTSSGKRTNQQQISNEAANNYYRRKIFKKENQSSFQVENLLSEWGDSDSEQPKSQTIKGSTNNLHSESTELRDMDDVISLTSGTSDSDFGFVGEPYYDVTNPFDSQPTSTK